MIALDHTKRSEFVSCPRKYYNRYVRNLQGQNGSPALRYGIGYHACMEGFYQEIAEKGWSAHATGIAKGAEKAQQEWTKESTKYNFNDEDYRNLPNLMKAFVKYLETFHFDEGMMEILEPEKVFKILMNPTKFEQEKFPGIEPFYFTGRMDLEVSLNGRPWILEFKTTSRPLSMQASTLHRSPQVMGYNYAAKATSLLKEIPDGSLVVLHQISAYKSRTTGHYGEPKFDFTRNPQIFSIEDLANWRLSFVSDAYAMQSSTRHELFPMRLHSCYTYGACTFVNICEQNRVKGDEIMQGIFVDQDPWDVTKDESKLVTIGEEDLDLWNSVQRRISA
jgi:hypothetical protein